MTLWNGLPEEGVELRPCRHLRAERRGAGLGPLQSRDLQEVWVVSHTRAMGRTGLSFCLVRFWLHLQGYASK